VQPLEGGQKLRVATGKARGVGQPLEVLRQQGLGLTALGGARERAERLEGFLPGPSRIAGARPLERARRRLGRPSLWIGVAH